MGAPDARHLLADPEALASWIATHHPTAQAAVAQARAAHAERDESALLPNPELEVAATNIAVGERRRQELGLAAAGQVGLELPLDVTERGPRVRAAELRSQAAREEARHVLETLVHQARGSLGQVAWLQARQEVLAENLALARQAAEVTERRVAHGEASGADLARLRLEALRLEAEVERARSELEAALRTCAAHLHAACDLQDGADLLASAAPVPQAIDFAPERRADLAALRLQARAEGEEAVRARRRRIPSPTLRLQYEHDPHVLSNDDPYTVGVGLRFALPLFDRGQHEEAAAAARQRALEATRQQAERSAEAEVTALAERLDTLRVSADRLGAQGLEDADQVVRATEISFEQGESSVTDLLLARRDRLDLQLDLLGLHFDLFEVRNDLRRLLGLDSTLDLAGTP